MGSVALHPRFLRERLAEHLRQQRERAGLSQGDAANQMAWSMSKLQRIETGVVGISATDTKALLDLYNTSDEQTVKRLLTIATQARRRDQFTPYRKFLSPDYQALLSYEDSATDISSVNAAIIPGLLQTPLYARALLSARYDGEILRAHLKAREVRQELLTRINPPHFVFIIDEGALHRHVGGRGVLLEQLTHLTKLAERPNVTLHIIPLNAGAYIGLWETYTIIKIEGSPLIDEEAETIVYREGGDDRNISRGDSHRIAQYETAFHHVRARALNQEETLKLIDQVRFQIDGTETSRRR